MGMVAEADGFMNVSKSLSRDVWPVTFHKGKVTGGMLWTMSLVSGTQPQ